MINTLVVSLLQPLISFTVARIGRVVGFASQTFLVLSSQ